MIEKEILKKQFKVSHKQLSLNQTKLISTTTEALLFENLKNMKKLLMTILWPSILTTSISKHFIIEPFAMIK